MIKNVTVKYLVLHCLCFSVLAFFSFAPHVYRNTIAPQGTFYTNVHKLLNDYYLYISVIRQGRYRLDQVIQQTTEPTKPAQLHLYYLVLGRVASYIGITDIQAYWGSMVLWFFLYYVAVSLLVHLVVPRRFFWVSMLVIFFAGAFPKYEATFFGQIFQLGRPWWSDLDIFSRVLRVPHHLFSLTSTLFSLYFFFRYHKKRKKYYLLVSGVCFLGGQIFYVIPGFVVFVGLSIYHSISAFVVSTVSLWRYKRIRFPVWFHDLWYVGTIVFFGISTIAVSWYVRHQLVSLGFPWSDILKIEDIKFNAEIYPMTWYAFLFSFGFLPYFLPLAIRKYIRKPSYFEGILWSIIIAVIVCYALSTQHILTINKIRYVHTSLYVFIGMLVAIGIADLLNGMHRKTLRLCTVFFITVIVGSSTVMDLISWWWPEMKDRPIYMNLYIPDAYFRAAEFLRSNTPLYSHVITPDNLGTFLPAFTNNVFYISNEISTLDFPYKKALMDRFYTGIMYTEEAQALLREHKIAYIFWDPFYYGVSFPDAYFAFATPIYEKDGFIIAKTKY